MHIVYLCNEYPPYPHGGIGSFVKIISRQLVQKGHKVSVVGNYKIAKSLYENDDGVDVHRLAAKTKWKTNFFYNHRQLSQQIRDIDDTRRIDLIEGNESSFGLVSIRNSIPKIIRIEGGHHFFSATLGSKPRLILKILEKRSFRKADFFCSVSQFAADKTRELLNLHELPIAILPNPVDTSLFHPFTQIEEIEGLIIFTGGLREKKGVRQLVQAMERIVDNHPTSKLWIQGADFLDPKSGRSLLDILKSEIPPSISSHILFKGHVPHDQLPMVNAQASVLVYPSWMETQGIVVIEGMASEKPVIASQTGPGPEIIKDGIDGLLCDPYSPESIADKVIMLLNDAELRKKLSINARKKALSEFSLDSLIDKNIEFYKSCLN